MTDGIANELRVASPRPQPHGAQADKKNYAERLSRALATRIAKELRPHFSGILPDERGGLQESPARSARGVKRLDVNYSKPEIGLGLGVSIKTLNFRDPKTRRYTKNYTRIDNELRAEAKDYHQRQPYAVLVAVIFLPVDSCDDGSTGAPSSFGSAVKAFRHRAGRLTARDEEELFERIFIGLYDDAEGPSFGNVAFFDVQDIPPRIGKPGEERTLSFPKLIASIVSCYDVRNNPPFQWDEGGQSHRPVS